MSQSNLKRASLIASAGGVGIALLLGAGEILRRVFRNAQLFNPSDEPVGSWSRSDFGLDPRMTDVLTFRTEDGETLYGWYCRASAPIASLLYCHGNTGNLTNSAANIRHLVKRGINVFVFDYRGFGKSSGTPSVSGIVMDARAAARRHDLIRPIGIPSVLYGYSLGGAVAAQIIGSFEFAGLILQSSFTNLADIARSAFPKLPVHLLSGKDFDTLSVVSSLEVPLLVIHGRKDETIPYSMGRQLYRACPTDKSIEIIPRGMHKNLYEIAPERVAGVIECFSRKLSLRRQA